MGLNVADALQPIHVAEVELKGMVGRHQGKPVMKNRSQSSVQMDAFGKMRVLRMRAKNTACTVSKSWHGQATWQGNCFSLSGCQARCIGACVGFNWWSSRGGCRTYTSKTGEEETPWPTIAGTADCVAAGSDYHTAPSDTTACPRQVAPDGSCAEAPNQECKSFQDSSGSTCFCPTYDTDGSGGIGACDADCEASPATSNSCLNYHCPPDFQLKENAAQLTCSSDDCSEEDHTACCDPEVEEPACENCSTNQSTSPASPPHQNPNQPPEDPDHPGTLIVDNTTFIDLVMASDVHFFLVVTAEWCPYSRACRSELDSLAQVLRPFNSEIQIGTMDHETNLDRWAFGYPAILLREGWVPNIKLFPRGNKFSPVPYDHRPRTVTDFLTFIEEVTGLTISTSLIERYPAYKKDKGIDELIMNISKAMICSGPTDALDLAFQAKRNKTKTGPLFRWIKLYLQDLAEKSAVSATYTIGSPVFCLRRDQGLDGQWDRGIIKEYIKVDSEEHSKGSIRVEFHDRPTIWLSPIEVAARLKPADVGGSRFEHPRFKSIGPDGVPPDPNHVISVAEYVASVIDAALEVEQPDDVIPSLLKFFSKEPLMKKTEDKAAKLVSGSRLAASHVEFPTQSVSTQIAVTDKRVDDAQEELLQLKKIIAAQQAQIDKLVLLTDSKTASVVPTASGYDTLPRSSIRRFN